MKALKIATFNINGIRSRLPALLAWLEREQPDIACLQELKAADQQFPRAELEAAGYGSLHHGQPSWNGVAILVRGTDPLEVRRGLPGLEEDSQSRYLEAAAHGVLVACLYLPNGNPQPGPKFDYKLAWMERLRTRMRELAAREKPKMITVGASAYSRVIDFERMAAIAQFAEPGQGLRGRARHRHRVAAGLLRPLGLLTRDARSVERKKPGQPGARKKFQFSKR